jgi:hypothetical protein
MVVLAVLVDVAVLVKTVLLVDIVATTVNNKLHLDDPLRVICA